MRNTVIIIALFLTSLTASAQVSYSRFDVNNDHEVNVSDVTVLVNIILGTEKSTRGDVNGDETVNVNDVTALVDFILGKRMINGHEFVDLGLPSGTLWATQNVGASTSQQTGDYYAWGELETKDTYTWATYALCGGTFRSLTRYCDNGDYGTVDNKTQLTLADDAAYQQWGGLWRIPTKAQAQELKSQCKWVLDSGRGGYLLTGPNGNTLFMPLTGYKEGSKVYGLASSNFWTSTLADAYPYNANCLVFEQSTFDRSALRSWGYTIRPVAK